MVVAWHLASARRAPGLEWAVAGSASAATAGMAEELAARLRAGAAALRRVAAASSTLLAPVIVLDDDETWRSPWQRRCHARIGEWASALVAGARAARDRAAHLDLLAVGGARRAATLGPPAVTPPPGRDSSRPGRGAVATDVLFSPERLAELARRLRVAAEHAARLAAEARYVSRDLPADEYGVQAADGLWRGLDLLAVEAPEMAGAIDSRMARFTSAETAVGATSLMIDHAGRSGDAAPVRQGTVRPAVAALAEMIGADPFRLDPRDLNDIATRLGRLDPAALQAVVSGLRGRPLEVLAVAVGIAPMRMDLRMLEFLPAVVSLGDLILRGAPAAMVAEVARLFPGLDPPMGGPYPPWAYDPGRPPSSGELTMREHSHDPVWARGVTPSDVGQGAVGDCYLLASLIGIARADPGLLRRNLRENPNGTVTVTFHAPTGPRSGSRPRPGAPGTTGTVLVTVTRDLPLRATAGQEFAADADNAEGEPELWAALYEKAYARMAGSYAGIEGGDPATAMEYLTGLEAVRSAPSAVGIEDVAGRLAAGGVVTVVTRPDLPPGSDLVPNHAYAVLGADLRTGMVLLRNPWDQTGADDRLDWHGWGALEPALAGVQWASTGRGPPAR